MVVVGIFEGCAQGIDDEVAFMVMDARRTGWDFARSARNKMIEGFGDIDDRESDEAGARRHVALRGVKQVLIFSGLV